MKPRSRAVRIRKYAVTAYQRTALRSLMPPDDITVSEWAERYRILGLKIAYYRKKAGYTQESFAEKIGKSHNFIAQVEGPGTTKGVSLETLFKIAETLGVPPSRLLEED